ncbi:MAG: pyridoxal-dependent decarboxylase [Bacteroidetes bacterium]|nr:pyridoxal-dependent decarboxylase [Bacteroidota bacterium]
MKLKIPTEILAAYNPEKFKEDATKVIEMLHHYLVETSNGDFKTVLPKASPEEVLSKWSEIKETQDGFEMIDNLIKESQHIHNARYVGHQVTAPLPFSAVNGIVSSLLNNSTAVFEMSPVDTIMQKRVVEWMCEKIGYGSNSDGVLTSGGTIGNLTALLAARQVKGSNVWKEGIGNKKLAVLVSELSHYSIERAVAIMGMGTDSVFKLPVKPDSKIDTAQIESVFNSAVKKGYTPIALVANAASTATGCYDEFIHLADFCEGNNLWFHVDGAHGASAAVSKKYFPLLNGIERADSIVWDMHKMMLMPALVTGVLFKEGDDTYNTFLQEASYLFNNDPRSEWFNYAHRTLECTKDMMGMRPYISLKTYGEDFFEKYIDYSFDLTKYFSEAINNSSDFELAVPTESNIICFRYNDGVNNSDDLQKEVRKRILASEKFYLVQTNLFGKTYMRCTIINPLTEFDHLLELLDLIRMEVKNIVGGNK